MMSPHPLQQAIESSLRSHFEPTQLTVRDVSDAHKGHAAWRAEGGTHFEVAMTSAHFRGKSRLEQQRMVHRALTEDNLIQQLHALTLSLSS